MSTQVQVEGPSWCDPGLDLRGGRYPLSVEAPVMAMVDRLVPGASTLTRLVRYYSLYWALAEFAQKRNLDASECQTVLRRAEVAMALVSLTFDREPLAHGVDRVHAQITKGKPDVLVDLGPGTYSPRPWGFWSQYNGPSIVLGTVRMDGGALRAGRHSCPTSIRAMFKPLLELASSRPLTADDAAQFSMLALDRRDTPDIDPLRELFTATLAGEHIPEDWTGNDQTRRATMRILVRSVQLRPSASWTRSVRDCVAYGDTATSDRVLADEDRALAWRGVLLRHYSVGAWRRLWANLVQEVGSAAGSATKDDLYSWISDHVPSISVQDFVDDLPEAVDGANHPLPAEDQIASERPDVEADVAILLVGSLRRAQLAGRCLAAFLGHRRGRGQFLDPSWVEYRRREHATRPLSEFARALVDDMLAQSRRVALRKLRVDSRGRMTLFTKLHERNGRYFAAQPEGAGNVGLRIEQLGFMAEQLGLFEAGEPYPTVTASARTLLDLPT